MRCKVSLASGLCGTLTLKDSASREAPAVTPSRQAANLTELCADVVRSLLGDQIHRRESVFVLSLDARQRIVASHEISVGSLMSSVIHPREVFRPAIIDSAAAVILAHNHPSGDPSPSAEDHQVTVRLAEAGTVLGIRLLDHVVVTADSFRSFRNEGWLPERG